jgi:hypothetical protein
MNKEQAQEIYNSYLVAEMGGGTKAGELVLYKLLRQRYYGRWDLFTLCFWNGVNYLSFRNPRMILMVFPWLKLAVLGLLNGPSERIK